MTPTITLRAALADPALLGNVLSASSWRAWRCLLIAAMGEALTDDERDTFKQLTGREHEPLRRVEELIAIVGRRGGKSRAMSTLACYIAALCTHSLVRGEVGVLLLIAPDARQAGIALNYCEANFEQSPILRQLIANRTNDTLTLRNRISIEVRASNFRRLRGPSYVGIIADEAAFWHSDEFSANADAEILNAVRPGLATTGGPLIIASSPYARRGVLFDAWRKHYGAAGDPLLLVAKGSSREFHPTLPAAVVARALERDPAAASAEYLANFRTDIESFVSREAVEACVALDVRERGAMESTTYQAFCDPSGGSADSMTLAIGHKEGDIVVLDALRERRPPFSPEDVVTEFAELLQAYRVGKVVGDRYAGEWPIERFREHGIVYEAAAAPKNDLYRDLLPAINSRKLDLLDHPRLISQLCGLERRTARGGRDSIDHAPGAHDDVANCVAGLAALLAAAVDHTNMDWVFGPDDAHAGMTPRALSLAERADFARAQLHAFVWSDGGTRPPWSY